MKKRIVLVLVALLCMSALLCFAASADQPKVIASGEHDGGPVTWKITSDGVLTISGNRSVQAMNAKDYLWHPYADIITKIVVEEGIPNVPANAFNGMKNVKTVELSSTVSAIGKEAFRGCTSLETFECPELLTKIEAFTFYDCTSLKSVTFNRNLTEIDNVAFMNCTSLTELNFAMDGFLKKINECAFYNTGVICVVIPQSVGEIAKEAFACCPNLEKVIMYSGATRTDAFGNCENFKELVLHEGTDVSKDDIRGYATIEHLEIRTEKFDGLSGYEHLTSVLLGAEIKEYRASWLRWFEGCSALSKLTIEPGFETIQHNMFAYCTALSEVVIPDTVKTIGMGAFMGCDIKRIAIPQSVECLENNVFMDSALLEVAFHGAPPETISNGTFTGVTVTAYYPADNEAWTADKLRNYGGAVTWVPVDCSAGHVEEQLVGRSATCTRTGLTEGSRCFYCGTAIVQQTEISQQDHSYGEWTIVTQPTTDAEGTRKRICLGCGEIEEQSIDKLEAPAENACGENLTWSFKDGVLTISGTGNMYEYSKDTQSPWWDIRNEVKKVVIAEGVTNISDWAFYCLLNLEDVVIPSTVVSIDGMAFDSCQNLEKITIPANVTSIGFRAFSGCRKLQSVTIPDSVEFIGRYAFRNCVSLTEVHVGSGVTQIDIGAFEGCSSLEKIYFYGDMPYGLEACFKNIKTTAYYPAGNDTWTEEGMKNNEQGAKITWKPYCYDEHSYGDWVTVKEPTESEEGRKEKTCSVCGDVKSKTIDKLDPAPTEPAPTEPAPTEPTPTEPAPTEPIPTEPAPTEPAPTEPAPTEPAPTEPAPTQPAETEPQETEPAPTEPAPTEKPQDPPKNTSWGWIAAVLILVAGGAAVLVLKKTKK